MATGNGQTETRTTGRYIPWIYLTAAGALHLTANIVAYFGPICTYDIFLTLGLLLAVVLSAGEFHFRPPTIPPSSSPLRPIAVNQTN